MDQNKDIDKVTDDFIDSYQRQIDDLQELLDKKMEHVTQSMTKNGNLKAYAESLKDTLAFKFTSEGQVMPPELFEAPEILSPRNEQLIASELRKTKERRDEILQNGRIDQLEAENAALKE